MSETAEKDSTHEQPQRKHVREPPSVPFIWEVKPGWPKKGWKPENSSFSSVHPALPPPVKLIASVPFTWEEKPGKPLPSFLSEHEESSSPSASSPKFTVLPPPPLYTREYNADISADLDDETDAESFGFYTDDSFSSAPSPLANCLVSSAAISGAIPVDEFDYLNEQMMTSSPTSPMSESDSSTSSYMTGASSLVGASFLEKLFPFRPPESGFLENVAENSEEDSSAFPEVEKKACCDGKRNGSVVRKAPTLGELIMMSRRRSYMRKAVEMRKQNLPMELIKNRASGCCFIAPGIKLIEGLEWKKFQPRLKFV